jgi:hypothetical protein
MEIIKNIKKSINKKSKMGLSIYLIEKEQNLQMNVNLSRQNIDLLTDILVQTKIESLSEGSQEGKEGSDTIDIYMKVLALIVNTYQEKLKQIIKLIDDEKRNEN